MRTIVAAVELTKWQGVPWAGLPSLAVYAVVGRFNLLANCADFAHRWFCEVKLPTGIMPSSTRQDRGKKAMRDLVGKIFRDESGMIVSSEIILVGTILVLGSIAGLTSLHYALNGELKDAANAVESMDGGQGDTYFLSDFQFIRSITWRYH